MTTTMAPCSASSSSRCTTTPSLTPSRRLEPRHHQNRAVSSPSTRARTASSTPTHPCSKTAMPTRGHRESLPPNAFRLRPRQRASLLLLCVTTVPSHRRRASSWPCHPRCHQATPFGMSPATPPRLPLHQAATPWMCLTSRSYDRATATPCSASVLIEQQLRRPRLAVVPP